MSPDPTPAVVIGLDLSLRSTGIAHADGTTTTFSPTADGTEHYGIVRLCEIRDHIAGVVYASGDLELVVVEALAFDAHDSKREQAQLAGLIRCLLYDMGVPFLLVAPGTLKLYATGSGKATKLEMIRAADKRLGYQGASDNEADALWLRAIGADLLGVPVAYVPDAHRKALRTLHDTVPVRRH
jgi:Holliday junction resolvasome RuvABC endonuclease subunit